MKGYCMKKITLSLILLSSTAAVASESDLTEIGPKNSVEDAYLKSLDNAGLDTKQPLFNAIGNAYAHWHSHDTDYNHADPKKDCTLALSNRKQAAIVRAQTLHPSVSEKGQILSAMEKVEQNSYDEDSGQSYLKDYNSFKKILETHINPRPLNPRPYIERLYFKGDLPKDSTIPSIEGIAKEIGQAYDSWLSPQQSNKYKKGLWTTSIAKSLHPKSQEDKELLIGAMRKAHDKNDQDFVNIFEKHMKPRP